MTKNSAPELSGRNDAHFPEYPHLAYEEARDFVHSSLHKDVPHGNSLGQLL
jgi:hypothetical protein